MKILVTGGSGMVGRSLQKILPDAIYVSSQKYNLTMKSDIMSMIYYHRPDVVVHLAAKVGGIMDNINRPAEYFTDNIMMNTMLIDECRKAEIPRFIGILSTCMYPDVVDKYPMTEDQIHLGPPTKTNYSYGYAKRAMGVQIDSYNEQYDTKYQYLIPCNLFGEFDKFGENSHFVAALLKKIINAKRNNLDKITLFGTGNPLRQFMYSDDLSFVIKKCIDDEIYDNMNVGTDRVLTIDEMTRIAMKICDAEHIKIEYDESYPDGQYRKDVSIEKLQSKIPDFKPTSFEDGLSLTYQLIKDKI
jgi:GDP-L-fucose synthase